MATSTKKKRRLTDLYVVGEYLELDDGEGEAVRVYVRKLTPTRHEKAMKRANAARSAVLAGLRDQHGDVYLEIRAQVDDMDRDVMIDYLVEERLMSRSPAIEAELADEEEWSKDGYLDGLRDSWLNGLEEVYTSDPEDEEAGRVLAEMKRFTDKLEELVEGERESIERDISSYDDEKLQRLVMEKFVEAQASIAWLTEFRMSEVWLSVFDEDKKTPYFESRDEVDELEAKVLRAIQEKYRDLAVEPQAGKG